MGCCPTQVGFQPVRRLAAWACACPRVAYATLHQAFYIFTIIKIVTRSIVILTMPLTYLPSLKIARLPFATFARLARHGDTTRWRLVSRAMRKDQHAPAYLLKKRNLFCNEFVMAFLFE